ncbi:MAG: hypothetical protein DESF_01454 [Desulfovibrio sp.]
MDKMRMESQDLTQANIEKIAELFPGVITEAVGEDGKLKKAVNFALLKQVLSDDVIDGDEAYEFTWVGKKASIVEAGKPIRKTLRPVAVDETEPTGLDSEGKPYCSSGSKNWESTENLYIEGDNLDVLKLLQESYLGKVKMIYIDPPYNTGNDFIYRDNFTMDKDDYDEESGAYGKDGDKLFRNTESNGRFHSDWCSMMYPRLVLARNFLREDGAIFVSCDEGEHPRLRLIMDEVFGQANLVSDLIWAAGRKNDSRLISVSHEYIVCYAKNADYLREKNILWRQRKKGLSDIYVEYNRLKRMHDDDFATITREMKAWYKRLSNDHPAKAHKHYAHVDERGLYFPDNISWPGGGGPKYEVLHPRTRKPVKVPSRGWMTSDPQKMHAWIADNRVHFGDDESSVPCIKSYLRDRELQTPYSVFYQDGRASSKRLRALMGGSYFDFPKDELVLQEIAEMFTVGEDITLDFFSGSATTAHAVMQLNAEDGGNRKFIMVQLPEECPPDSEAAKAGYTNICEIGKERIRRAGEKIKTDNAGKEGIENLDTGFRVLKLDSTNMKDVYYGADEYDQHSLTNLISNIKEDRNDMDLLYGCLLEWGLPLSLPHTSEKIDGVTVHTYNNGDLMACFAEKISEAAVREIAKRQPLRVVFRDSSFASAPAKINVEEIFKLMAPNTTVKVI